MSSTAGVVSSQNLISASGLIWRELIAPMMRRKSGAPAPVADGSGDQYRQEGRVADGAIAAHRSHRLELRGPARFEFARLDRFDIRRRLRPARSFRPTDSSGSLSRSRAPALIPSGQRTRLRQ